ncbi:50S ribosomal protein L25 [Fibrobacterota bacterium]
MMETPTLSAKSREKKTKGYLSELRKSGRVPGVIYGHSQEPCGIHFSENELGKLLKNLKKNKIIHLNIEGKEEPVIIKDITRHPVKHIQVLHIDFLRVNEDSTVTVQVPIKHVGMPKGVKNEGGLFAIMKRFVKVKCKVRDIPDAFEQDVSDLALNAIVYAQDLEFLEGTIITPPRTALFGVTPAHKVEEVLPEPGAEVEGEEGAEEEGNQEAKGASEAPEGAGSGGSKDPKSSGDKKPEKPK